MRNISMINNYQIFKMTMKFNKQNSKIKLKKKSNRILYKLTNKNKHNYY